MSMISIPPLTSSRSESRLILVIAAVQFVNILDFMMVMPLGPKFADDLGFARSALPMVASSYAISAAISGFICAFFLDRFDRRVALVFSMLGLAIGTVAAVVATSLPLLITARAIAGAFGGPATSLALSIVADVIPAERRGKALGTVMTAFAVASVLGVPMGLTLAELGTWHTPFVATGLLVLVATALVWIVLPPLRGHLEHARTEKPMTTFARLLVDPAILLSYAMTACGFMGMFAIIPNISAYVQGNLGYPGGRLDVLYLAGGIASFLTTRPIGRWVDRLGSVRVATFGVVASVIVIYAGFGQEQLYRSFPAWFQPYSVALLFILFMVANGLRNVPYGTLTSKVPKPNERARFMSMQSVVQHLAAGGGGFLAHALLRDQGDRLVGMPNVAMSSMTLIVLMLLFMYGVERAVGQRGGATVPVVPKAA